MRDRHRYRLQDIRVQGGDLFDIVRLQCINSCTLCGYQVDNTSVVSFCSHLTHLIASNFPLILDSGRESVSHFLAFTYRVIDVVAPEVWSPGKGSQLPHPPITPPSRSLHGISEVS